MWKMWKEQKKESVSSIKRSWQKQQNFRSNYWTVKCYKIDCRHTEWINSESLSLKLILTSNNDSVLLINLFDSLIT